MRVLADDHRLLMEGTGVFRELGGYHMVPQFSGLHWNFNLVPFYAASCCAAGTQLTALDPQVDQDLIAF